MRTAQPSHMPSATGAFASGGRLRAGNVAPADLSGPLKLAIIFYLGVGSWAVVALSVATVSSII
jgi:hypothetical protein